MVLRMVASRIIVLSLLLCSQFGISVLKVALNAENVKVDCSHVTKGSIANLEITLPSGLTAKSGDTACTLTSGGRKLTAAGCTSQTAMTVLVYEPATSGEMVTDIRYFNVSCINGGTENVQPAVYGIDLLPIDVLPKVNLVLLTGDVEAITKEAKLTEKTEKATYGETLYLTFALPKAQSKSLIPLSCAANGSSHSEVTLFDISLKPCIKSKTVLKTLAGGKYIESKTIEDTAVAYAQFTVFSFIEPSPTVTISCQVRVCETIFTAGNEAAGDCKLDFDKMNDCKATAKRRRRDVKQVTRMTGGQEHGQVHRVSTSYSIQENIGATGGSNKITQTFSLLLASILILFL